MNVLIKGMDMPKSCATCKLVCQDTAYKISTFEQVITYFCKGLDENNVIKNTLVRLPNCPLTEIPTPHGRLIDADKLELPLGWQGEIVKATLKNSSTIIEAEG